MADRGAQRRGTVSGSSAHHPDLEDEETWDLAPPLSPAQLKRTELLSLFHKISQRIGTHLTHHLSPI